VLMHWLFCFDSASGGVMRSRIPAILEKLLVGF
jgi:hypothetical protein